MQQQNVDVCLEQHIFCVFPNRPVLPMASSPSPILLSKYSVVLLQLLRTVLFSLCLFVSFFHFLFLFQRLTLTSFFLLVWCQCSRWYGEKIRFSLFFLCICVVEIDVLFRVQVLLASSDERRRRRTCENKKYIRVQTHIRILHYSFHPSISSMYKNNFDYIINPRLVSIFFGVCCVRIGQ